MARLTERQNELLERYGIDYQLLRHDITRHGVTSERFADHAEMVLVGLLEVFPALQDENPDEIVGAIVAAMTEIAETEAR